MKIICIAAMALALYACNKKAYVSNHRNIATSYNDANGNRVLLGIHPQKALQTPPFSDWFNKNFAAYAVDSAAIASLRPLVKDRHVDIFMGTWCGDSKREVPRMCKVLLQAGLPASAIRLIMVDNRDSAYKQSPGHEEKDKFIHRVPTLIVYDGEKELNRIVESPVVSIEQDLISILSRGTYTPHYMGAAWLQAQFQHQDITEMHNRKRLLADSLQSLVHNAAELNAVGYVWMGTGQWQQALLAFELNALLYPNNANVYDSLGDIAMKMNDKAAAAMHYRKVLQLQPGHANAQKMLAQLQ